MFLQDWPVVCMEMMGHNGGPLSDLYQVGQPKFVNILSIALIVTLADVFLSIKTAA